MGNPVAGKCRDNEGEAEVVRRMFSEFVAGKSPRAIAKMLNVENVVGPSGKAWTASTIHGNRQRGSGTLNNELYVGRWFVTGCAMQRTRRLAGGFRGSIRRPMDYR